MEENIAMMPVAAHESDMDRAGRREKWHYVIIILLVLLLVGSNVAWMVYESQWETVTTTEIEADQEGDGPNIVSGGDLTYGAESAR